MGTLSHHLIVMTLARRVCVLLVEDGCCGAPWVTCGVPLMRPQSSPASGTLSCGGKEMWEGGSVLVRPSVASPDQVPGQACQPFGWRFKFVDSCFWLCSVVIRTKGKRIFAAGECR